MNRACRTADCYSEAVPKSLSADRRDVEWSRESLYDSTKGQIGLAWSIFKVHGTPTEDSWPVRILLALAERKD